MVVTKKVGGIWSFWKINNIFKLMEYDFVYTITCEYQTQKHRHVITSYPTYCLTTKGKKNWAETLLHKWKKNYINHPKWKLHWKNNPLYSSHLLPGFGLYWKLLHLQFNWEYEFVLSCSGKMLRLGNKFFLFGHNFCGFQILFNNLLYVPLST